MKILKYFNFFILVIVCSIFPSWNLFALMLVPIWFISTRLIFSSQKIFFTPITKIILILLFFTIIHAVYIYITGNVDIPYLLNTNRRIIFSLIIYFSVSLMNVSFEELSNNIRTLNGIGVVVAFSSILLYLIPGFSNLPFIRAGDWADTGLAAIGIRRLFIPGETLIFFFSAFYICLLMSKPKIKYYFYLMILLIALYLPLTRTSWIAVLITVIIYIFSELKTNKRIKSLVIVLMLVISTLLFSTQFLSILPDRVNSILPDVLAGESGQSSLASRYLEWNLAISSIKTNPVLGYGFGIPYRDYFYVLDASSAYTGNLDVSQSHVHNIVLNILVAFGIVGLFLFGLFIYKIFKIPFTNIGGQIFGINEIKLYWYSLFTVVVAGFAGGMIVFLEVNLFVLFIIGMINSAYILKMKETLESDNQSTYLLI